MSAPVSKETGILTPPLRVACVIAGMQAGGAERVMAQLCNYLVTRGHDVTLVTLAPASQESFYELSDRVRLSPLGRFAKGTGLARIARVVAWITGLRKTLGALRPDIVISFVDLTNVMVLLATVGLRVPVIVSERIDPTAYSHRLSGVDRTLRRLLYSRANRIVVQTRRAAKFFSNYSSSMLATIPNPVPMYSSAARPEQPSIGGRFRIVGIGRLDHQKGFDILVGSFARLADSFPNWDIAIFGQGPDRKRLLAQIESHGLSRRVELKGVTRDIVNEAMHSHIIAFPSRYEGFPNALAEAMAVGRPAVAFENVSGVEDLVVPGETGILVHQHQEVSDGFEQPFSDGLRQLMTSAELRTRMGAAAKAHVRQFRPDIVFGQWDELIAAALRSNEDKTTAH